MDEDFVHQLWGKDHPELEPVGRRESTIVVGSWETELSTGSTSVVSPRVRVRKDERLREPVDARMTKKEFARTRF